MKKKINKKLKEKPEEKFVLIKNNLILFRKCTNPECKEPWKELCKENFYIRNENGKWNNICKDCCKSDRKSYREIKLKVRKEINYNNILNSTEIITSSCIICGVIKELSIENFTIRSDNGKFKKECIECLKKIHREEYQINKEEIKKRRQENAETIRITQKEYRENNPEIIKKSKQNWADNNKDHIRKYKKEYNRNKRTVDPNFRLRKNISSVILKSLKARGKSKNKLSILKFLSYNMEQLKCYIEMLFESWMTWENWGVYNSKTWKDDDPSTWTWNLDHIISQSSFSFDSMDCSDFMKCWAMENLRPLSSKQNAQENRLRAPEEIAQIQKECQEKIAKHLESQIWIGA